MSEVPPTVSYADADGYHCYPLNTTCTQSKLFNAHPIASCISYYITSYITTILRHSSVTIVTVLDSWLPSLQRAAEWNGWAEEKLMQLAGYLRGRAQQEWDLLLETEKVSYSRAMQALQGKLEPANKILAAQDFRHISQGDHKSVADFIRRLEHTFKIAYGQDSMSQETRNTLLHGQLQDGLRYEIMKAPAVSGAQNYPELCLASQNEEKRLLELKKRQQYRQTNIPPVCPTRTPNSSGVPTANRSCTTPPSSDHRKEQDAESKKCYICGKVGHLQRNCRRKDKKSESTPGANRSGTSGTATNMVSSEEAETAPQPEDPFGFLLSDSDNKDIVSLVRVQDKGSRSQTAMVEVAGVPVHGIVDTGADITIMGPELFKKVAAIAKLKKSQFKKADKVPHITNKTILQSQKSSNVHLLELYTTTRIQQKTYNNNKYD